MSFQIDFEPIGRRVMVEPDTTLLDAAQRAGVMLTAVCGGEGACGRCIVRVMHGAVSAPTLTEEAELGKNETAEGWRLACQTTASGPVQVHVPPESLVTAQRTQTEGQTGAVAPQPAVGAIDAPVPPPVLHDLRSDAARLRDTVGLPAATFDTRALQQLPDVLREAQFHVSAFVRGPVIIGVRPAGTTPLGLAVDLGTTKIAGYLVDLATGETMAAQGAMNPQIAYGEDVMARINHAVTAPGGMAQLQTTVVDGLNGLARELCARTGRHVQDIADAVVVGNTAMHHLFLGLPVRQLGLAPYVAAESAALDLPARDIGLDLAPGAAVHLLPNIAGFVGADHVAMLLATGLSDHTGIALGMDIGTNTEVSLVARGRHLACSVASGPAFEGAHIRYGMRAAPGAIENAIIRNDQVLIKTVDNQPPVGLCGSGILDLMAQMLRAGIINTRGAMPVGTNARVRRGAHGPEYVVVADGDQGAAEITFSRADVSEIQLAKGAMRAGVRILLERVGADEADIDEVIIAGAFGTYLDVQSGIDIGMFPHVDRHRFKQVGNAAGAGARRALISTAERARAIRIAQHVEYVELTAEKGFQSQFAQALLLE